MPEVRITYAKAFGFKPGRKYILEFKQEAISQADIAKIINWLREHRVEGMAVVLPKNHGMKVRPLPKEQK